MPTTKLTPQLRIEVNGTPRRTVSGSTSCGFRSNVATASMQFAAGELPAQPGDRVTVWLGYQERGGQIVFSGEADDDTLQYWPQQPGAQCSGFLARMQRGLGQPSATAEPDPDTGEVPAYYATGITDLDIVEALCHLYGCPVGSLEGIVPATTFGNIVPVVLGKDQPGWALVEELDRLCFLKTFDAPDGTVRRLPVSGIPAGIAMTLTEGVHLLEGTRSRSRRGIINRVTMKGLTDAAGPGLSPRAEFYADSPYIPDPPRYQSEAWQSELAETEELCAYYATNRLGQTNRLSETVSVRLESCRPDVYPGMTLAIAAPHFQYDSGYAFWVEQVEHTWDARGLATSLGLLAATDVAGISSNLPPVPLLDVTLEMEVLADGTRVWVAFADGSASYDPDPEGGASDLDPQHGIATYLWSGDPVGPSTPAGLPRATYVYERDPTGATISLTVTDLHLKSATASVTLSRVMVEKAAVRDIWAAVRNDLFLTIDGGLNWRATGIPAEVIAEQAHPDYQLAAEESGALHRVTLDATGAFVDTPIAEPGGVSALHINLGPDGQGTDRCWLGCADGSIWLSPDNGQTWFPRATIVPPTGSAGTMVRHVEESPFALGTVYALCGPSMWVSFDDGVSFEAARTYPDHLLSAMRFASGRFADLTQDDSFHWMALAGTSDNTEQRLLEERDFEEVDWPEAAKPAQPSGMTMGVYGPALILCDTVGGGRTWHIPDFTGGGVLVQKTYDSAYGTPRHIIRDGRFDGVVYGAADAMIFKTFDTFNSVRALLALSSPNAGRMVAYGRLRETVLTHLAGDLMWIGHGRGVSAARYVYRLSGTLLTRVAHPLNGVGGLSSVAIQNCFLLRSDGGALHTYCCNLDLGRSVSHQQSVFRSVDNGVTWLPVAGLDYCYCMAVGPGGVWLAATANAGTNMFGGHTLHRSDDDGATWHTVHTLPVSATVTAVYASLAIDPNDSSRVLTKGVWPPLAAPWFWFSTDGGTTFVGLGNGAAPGDQASLTRGEWAQITPDGARVAWYRQLPSPAAPRYAPLVVGATAQTASGPVQQDAFPMALLDGTMYWYTRGGVFVSADQGTTWAVLLDNTTHPALGAGGSNIQGFVPGDATNGAFALPDVPASPIALLGQPPGGGAWSDLTASLTAAFPDLAYWCYREAAIRLTPRGG